MEVGDWCIVEMDFNNQTGAYQKIGRIDYIENDGEGIYAYKLKVFFRGGLEHPDIWYTRKDKLTPITNEVADIMRGIL